MLIMKIRKAVFPIAGLGSRFLPATKAAPKEMLPLVDKPLIQYAVEEAYAAGIRQMIFVTGRSKRSVEDHFDVAFELETELEVSMKYRLLSIVRAVKPDDMQCVYIRQTRALGLGHAVLCAEHLIDNEPFAVLLADDLIIAKKPLLSQMIEKYIQRHASIIAVENVVESHVQQYGIVAGKSVEKNLMDVQDIVEKPNAKVAPSTIGVVGRYILTPNIFKHIANQSSGVAGEVQLTDAIVSLLKQEKVYAYQFEGRRYDCGTKLGYMKAAVDLAEKHHEIGSEFSDWLKIREEVML